MILSVLAMITGIYLVVATAKKVLDIQTEFQIRAYQKKQLDQQEQFMDAFKAARPVPGDAKNIVLAGTGPIGN